jgi:hypothetical protein
MSEEATTTEETTTEAWQSTVEWGDYTPSDKINEFKSVSDLAKSYDEIRKDNSSKIRIPGEKATDEERAAFQSTLKEHLGLTPPESADKYSWKPDEDMADYFSEDEMQKYFDAGLDDKTVSMIMDDRVASIKAAAEAIQNAQAEMAAATKEELGQAWGDDYDARIKDVNAFIAKHPEAENALKAMGLANNKAIIELIDDAARSTREGRPEGQMSSQDAGKEIEQIKQSDAWKNVRHPDHDAAVRRMVELRKSMLD